ncbi:MAG: 50S ribosomal protein L11 methyltransferase [Gammaproteobacteria bacterium CG11_big_fil_rev_8_21_14_0_20_46_22]|nr:MAG: 50S ribosomal protein L11 methyltransferase [Gammaproteobacteria bacterium CG12_big_fil_rev_8_21_14_0_65_46_12]PIR10536.1 MAG: 50S ribosomal protein L11 methyltransferase [Gammaproteobacteria bacterium CG11_big_fil_rev_8_21_14_0_20_46_22]
MSYYQLAIGALKSEHAQAVEDYLFDTLGADTVTVLKSQAGLLVSNKDDTHPLPDTVTLQAIFTTKPPESALQALYEAQGIPPDNGTLSCHEDQDWQTSFRQHFQPISIADRLWIRPVWDKHDTDPQPSLYIDPGMAFGTGSHATTALCLEALTRVLKPGQAVVDYGCGSGILGLSALMLGAKKACGVDIDETALVCAAQNAALNDIAVPEAFDIRHCEAETPPNCPIILANILAPVLIDLAPTLLKLCEPQGYLILSGLLEEQSPSVLSHYKNEAIVSEVLQRDEWIALILKKS